MSKPGKQPLGTQCSLAILSVLVCLTSCLLSCTAHVTRGYFEVLPRSPEYLLQSPDSRRTLFPELLKLYNGFETGGQWIDLRPMMQLTIENAYYSPGFQRTGLTGYLGTEVGRYDVMALGLQLASVQPMPDRPAASAPVQDLIADTQTTFRFYRLFYEIVFSRHDHSHGPVLLGAQSQAEIETLSRQLINPETVCSDHAPHCTVFPDACTVSIEMKVFANGKPRSVPWASLLASIAEQPHYLEMKRFYRGQLKPLRLNEKDPKSLLLPLLPGDHIAWH